MEQVEQPSEEENGRSGSRTGIFTKAGIALIVIGLILLADFNLKTGWLALVIVPVLGLLFLFSSLYFHKPAWMIPGALTLGLGIGSFLALSKLTGFDLLHKVGYALLSFGLSWVLVACCTRFLFPHVAWWALIPAGVIAAAGGVFIYTPMRWADFILYIAVGLGLAFLIWGWVDRLLGLIIPGCLLTTIGPGIYLGWANPLQGNGLTQTGIMLVVFAFGWGMITLFSRRVTQGFVWWPLIPGGVLGMVGWGLYIGGNPGNAVEFIGNTGSIGLILFGAYLLLLRRGIHH